MQNQEEIARRRRSGTKILQRAGERGVVLQREPRREQRLICRAEAVCRDAGLVPEPGGTVEVLDGMAARLQPEGWDEQDQRAEQG